ncbi:MAG: hypothetical protein HYT49_00745 [Candidatus Wildermuthbacteria bacterium]|nr:hypothetical protein [Candidatus Wildermuthbacteria bacterium]
MKDDDLKLQHGVDAERVALAYENASINGSLERLRVELARGYLTPKNGNLQECSSAIRRLLRDGSLGLVVPMRENGPVIRPLLTTLVKKYRVTPGSVLVMDNGSDEDALEEVRRYGKKGVRLACSDGILDILDWNRLLPILNLRDRPRGKGVAVLAGYLYWYITAKCGGRKPAWIGQNDAEIAEFRRYQCWEYLGYGIVTKPDAQYIKMAKFGRTNERCMTARWMLDSVAGSERIDPAIRRRAKEICYRLGGHKWMITGEFVLRWDLAMRRPFATSYLEETVTSLYAEDYCACHLPPGVDAVVQVGNPNPRLDAANNDRKESIMQQQISNFLLMLPFEETSALDTWTVETITRLNNTLMARPIVMGWIPSTEEPIVPEEVRNDRIIPSVTQLDQAGLIDWKKAERLFAP